MAAAGVEGARIVDVTTEPAPDAVGQPIRTFVAIGDSFTEGLNDERPDGQWAGWADRLADRLAAAEPTLRYANLAVRGKLLDQIVEDQLPAAVALGPDLIGFSAGGNDLLRPGSDPDSIAERFEAAVTTMRAAGCQVLVFTTSDPVDAPILRRLRPRFAAHNDNIHRIAQQHGCIVVDLWHMPALRDSRAWAADRIHLSPAGHEQVALLAAAALGLPVDADPQAPWPQTSAPTRMQRHRENLAWARAYLLPWIGRRLRGRSSGDGRSAKRPDLTPWPSEATS